MDPEVEDKLEDVGGVLYSSDDEAIPDERKHNQLLDSITNLDAKKKNRHTQRTVISTQVSEFNFTSNKDTGGKVHLNELLSSLNETGGHGELKKQLKTVEKKKQAVATPLPKHERQKIDRSTAYETVKQDIEKWDPIVKKNRTAEQLHFPLQKQDFSVITTDKFVKRFEPRTPLEVQVAALLRGSENVIQNNKHELTPAEQRALKAMDLDEAKERRKELMRHRALMSYKETKAKRQKKIKSKRYHRILKKEKLKNEKKLLDKLHDDDPEEFLERMNKYERDRAEERASLKHRGGTKYLKRQMIYAKFDDRARQEVQDMLQKSRELTQKQMAESSDESDTEEAAGQTTGDTHYSKVDDKNPWMSKPQTNVIKLKSDFSRPDAVQNSENVDDDGSGEDVDESDEEVDSEGDEEVVDIDGEETTETPSNSAENPKGLEGSGEESSEESDEDLDNSEDGKEVMIESSGEDKEEQSSSDDDDDEYNDDDDDNDLHSHDIDDIFNMPISKLKANGRKGTIDGKGSKKNTKLVKKAGKMVSDENSDGKNKSSRKNGKTVNVKKGSGAGKDKNGKKAKLGEDSDVSNEEDSDSDDAMISEGLVRKRTLEEVEAESDGEGAGATKTTKAGPSAAKKQKAEKRREKQRARSQGQKKAQTEAYIDPNKLFTMDKKLKQVGAGPKITEDDEEDVDAEEQQRMTIAQAFADDDVIQEFTQEKTDEIEKGKPKDIDLTLPGWGSWGGTDIKVSERKRKRFTIKAAPAMPRKDGHLGHVILTEKTLESVKKHQVSDLPYPYRNTDQFESSIRAPLGRTWNPESAHHKLIKPKVVTHIGQVITPMDKSEVFKDTKVGDFNFKRSKKDNKKHKGKGKGKKK